MSKCADIIGEDNGALVIDRLSELQRAIVAASEPQESGARGAARGPPASGAAADTEEASRASGAGSFAKSTAPSGADGDGTAELLESMSRNGDRASIANGGKKGSGHSQTAAAAKAASTGSSTRSSSGRGPGPTRYERDAKGMPPASRDSGSRQDKPAGARGSEPDDVAAKASAEAERLKAELQRAATAAHEKAAAAADETRQALAEAEAAAAAEQRKRAEAMADYEGRADLRHLEDVSRLHELVSQCFAPRRARSLSPDQSSSSRARLIVRLAFPVL